MNVMNPNTFKIGKNEFYEMQIYSNNFQGIIRNFEFLAQPLGLYDCHVRLSVAR
jgi:hypothetical protein